MASDPNASAVDRSTPEEIIISNIADFASLIKSSIHVLINFKGVSSLNSPLLEGPRQVMRNMHAMWWRKKEVDLTLECNDGVLYAHKLVMAAYSDRLNSRFNDYPLSQAITISLREYSSNSVFALLEFMYTTELTLTMTNIGELLFLANQFDIPHLKGACHTFLGNISIENCFHFRDVAKKYGLKHLLERVDKFMSDNFSDIINTQGFLTCIPADRLVRFLTENSRNVRGGWEEFRQPEQLQVPPMPPQRRGLRRHSIAPKDLVNHVEKVDSTTGMPE